GRPAAAALGGDCPEADGQSIHCPGSEGAAAGGSLRGGTSLERPGGLSVAGESVERVNTSTSREDAAMADTSLRRGACLVTLAGLLIIASGPARAADPPKVEEPTRFINQSLADK